MPLRSVRAGDGAARVDRAGAARVLSEKEAEEVRARTSQIMLALGMLASGTANTLTCKACLSSVSEGAEFNHPFVLAGCMFFGEIMCLGWYKVSMLGRSHSVSRAQSDAQKVPKHVFALPAICDILGTSIMYLGLTMTAASTYQMLRGSVIIFTGVLSATWLRRNQRTYHWVAMLLVFTGLLLVGSSSSNVAAAPPSPPAGTMRGQTLPGVPPPPPYAHSLHGESLHGTLQRHLAAVGRGLSSATASEGSGASSSADRAMIGNALVVFSQLFTALQMCVEQHLAAADHAPSKPTITLIIVAL